VNWTALHVAYATPAARLRVVTHLSTALSGPWYFADVPVVLGDAVQDGLEVGLRCEPGHQIAIEEAGAALDAAVRHGLVTALAAAEAPLVLQPRLFPGEAVLPCYPLALAADSSRAVARYPGLIRDEVVSAPGALVRAELALTYRAWMPRQSQRRTAMLWHANWLEAAAGESDDESLTAAAEATNAEGAAAAQEEELAWDPAPAGAYGNLRPRMRRQIARLIDRMRRRGKELPVDGATIQAILVARLAHTQVVRLWGPTYPQSLRREAALLRGLAS
jgi:hypothetical protein